MQTYFHSSVDFIAANLQWYINLCVNKTKNDEIVNFDINMQQFRIKFLNYHITFAFLQNNQRMLVEYLKNLVYTMIFIELNMISLRSYCESNVR